jgi:hypothetical protein
MKSFLSIDVDYWYDPKAAHAGLTSVLKRARRRGLPLCAVMNHQQLLSIVSASEARQLVNVDEHSDLTSSDIDELSCGTWVSYVKWRQEGKYLWVRGYPSTTHGNCNGDKDWYEGSDWGLTRTLYNPEANVGRFVNASCVGVGLCQSPEFARAAVQDVFRDLVKAYGVPYKKGRMNEFRQRRALRPSKRAA